MKNRKVKTKVTVKGDRRGVKTQYLTADIGHSCSHKLRRVNERTKSWYNTFMNGRLGMYHG